jgi:replicative DNA helicase
MKVIPYARELEERQRGTEFLGLDSGFDHLNYLCNGLDVGLFVLAAPPGEGKTTLVWQVCCQAAQRNAAPVIFVSYEQSEQELRDKALARLGGLEYRHVRRGRLRSGDPEQWGRLLGALDEYAGFAPQLTIVEGGPDTTVEAVREVASAKMARLRADRCLIAIDYLQIIPLAEADAGRVTSSKDRVDLHVSALRRVARDLNAAVLSISSENRAGYKGKTLDVFKESGGIEYSADIAAVLTPEQAGPAAPGNHRVENLTIVKNRNGERGVVKLHFYARQAKFVEVGREEYSEDPEQ